MSQAAAGTGDAAAQHEPDGSNSISEPQHVTLSSGARMPLVGLGTCRIDSADAIRTALDVGYRGLDCAAYYDNEQLVGEGLRDFIAAGGRQQLFITSKLWNECHHPSSVRPACEKTLADLGCGYLDLYLMHWPEAFVPGSELMTPQLDTSIGLLDTWRAMEALVEAGLVRAIGVSNCSIAQIDELLAAGSVPPVVNQVELHPHLVQRGLVAACARRGVTCMAYCPLGSPNDKALLQDPVVARVASQCGRTPAQVLLKWNVQRGVPVVPKAAGKAHQQANLQGMFAWRLSDAHRAELDGLDRGKRYCDFAWKDWGTVPDEPDEQAAMATS